MNASRCRHNWSEVKSNHFRIQIRLMQNLFNNRLRTQRTEIGLYKLLIMNIRQVFHE